MIDVTIDELSTYLSIRLRMGEFTASQIEEVADETAKKVGLSENDRDLLIKVLYFETLNLGTMRPRELLDLYRRYGVAYRENKSKTTRIILETIEDEIVDRLEQ